MLVFVSDLVSEMAVMSKLVLVALSKYSRSSKFLVKEHVLMWSKERELFLLGIFMVWTSSTLYYLQLTTFSESLKSWFWDELLNWLNNEFKLGGGFRTQLLELSSSLFLFCMLLLFMYLLNVLLFNVPNGNKSVLHLRQNQGSSFPLRYW